MYHIHFFMKHEKLVQNICDQALETIGVRNLQFKPMQRRGEVNRRTIVLGRTNLRTGSITIDIFTPRKREPKKISSILKILCHEVAHHQKKPFRQFYKMHWIFRQHYPEFYTQVTENIELLKKDTNLKIHF